MEKSENSDDPYDPFSFLEGNFLKRMTSLVTGVVIVYRIAKCV